MASTSSLRFLSILLLLLLFTSPFSSATSPDEDIHFSSTLNFPRIQAEKLIRNLNLFPKHALTAPVHDSLSGPKLVEKTFQLASLGDDGASVEELGHHAGYYRLPHSQAAR